MVSPQYHCKFDDTFETVRGIREETHGTWRQKCGFAREQRTSSTKSDQVTEFETAEKVAEVMNEELVPAPLEELGNENDFMDFGGNEEHQEGVTEHEGAPGELQQVQVQEDNQPNVRRSARTWNPSERSLESVAQESIALPASVRIAEYNTEYRTFIDDVHPISVLAQVDGDTMYWDQALKQHDAAELVKAAIDEISTHQENGHWKVVPLDDVPKGTPVLDAVWSMKRKRREDL
jgi:hypothetical protein